jgi:hypothetical protein
MNLFIIPSSESERYFFICFINVWSGRLSLPKELFFLPYWYIIHNMEIQNNSSINQVVSQIPKRNFLAAFLYALILGVLSLFLYAIIKSPNDFSFLEQTSNLLFFILFFCVVPATFFAIFFSFTSWKKFLMQIIFTLICLAGWFYSLSLTLFKGEGFLALVYLVYYGVICSVVAILLALFGRGVYTYNRNIRFFISISLPILLAVLIVSVALFFKNPTQSKCQFLDGHGQTDCYNRAAIEHNNYDSCFSIIGADNIKEECLMEVTSKLVKDNPNPNRCDNLYDSGNDRGWIKDLCYLEIGKMKQDVFICNLINDALYKEKCVSNIAVEKRDMTFCEVVEEDRQNDCYWLYGTKIKDPVACNKISDEYSSKSCLTYTR